MPSRRAQSPHTVAVADRFAGTDPHDAQRDPNAACPPDRHSDTDRKSHRLPDRDADTDDRSHSLPDRDADNRAHCLPDRNRDGVANCHPEPDTRAPPAAETGDAVCRHPGGSQ